MSPHSADLTEDAAFLRVLVSDPYAWRERLVERFAFGAGDHVRVTSTYQCEFPADLMSQFLSDRSTQRVKALVPITSRPKQPLLAFDLVAPGGGAGHLLRRRDIAALERGYIEELISTSPARDDFEAGLPSNLIEAICVHTPGLYNRLVVDARAGSAADARLAALSAYLTEGLGFALDEARLEQWMQLADRAGEVLTATLGEPRSFSSSSECVLLALPDIDPKPTSTEELRELIESYVAAIDAGSRAGDSAVLQAIADYGRRWELIAEIEVPLGEPWLVRTAEDRPLHWRRGRSHQVLSLGDAPSVHFEASVTDPSVSLAESAHELTTLTGDELPFGAIEAIRETSETLSLYTAQQPREPYYVGLAVAFTRPAYVRLTQWFIVGLVLAASLTTILVDSDQIVEKLAVVTVPTTFAAALLLVRESTALAGKLDAAVRAALGVATSALWIVAVVRLLCAGTLL